MTKNKNRMILALMGEYRRATKDYLKILDEISIEEFQEIKDVKTTDPDCKSIQTITFHVVQSGYTYTNYIGGLTSKKWLEYKSPILNPKTGIDEIKKMLDFTEDAFEGLWEKSNKELGQHQIKTRWNVTYNLEQLMAHAIVHILRHRRQIENFIRGVTR